jgi:hypothetical protein
MKNIDLLDGNSIRSQAIYLTVKHMRKCSLKKLGEEVLIGQRTRRIGVDIKKLKKLVLENLPRDALVRQTVS